MIHVYKAGGNWDLDGFKYHIIAIDEARLSDYLEDGWVLNLEEVKQPRKGAAYYRGEIKKLGARPASNASAETLAKQLEELQQNGPTTQRSDR